MIDYFPESSSHQVIRDAWRRAAATLANAFGQSDVAFAKFNIGRSIRPAALAIHVPLNASLTYDIDKRLHFVDLLRRYRDCRWHEPGQRLTQRVWRLTCKHGAVLHAEDDFRRQTIRDLAIRPRRKGNMFGNT